MAYGEGSYPFSVISDREEVSVRLKEWEISAIKRSFEAVFNEGTVSLFGSRTDDTKKAET